MYQIIYSSDTDGNNVKNNADKFKIQIYENWFRFSYDLVIV